MSSLSDIQPIKVEKVADIKVGDLVNFIGFGRNEWYLVTSLEYYAGIRLLATWETYGIYQSSLNNSDTTYIFYRPEPR